MLRAFPGTCSRVVLTVALRAPTCVQVPQSSSVMPSAGATAIIGSSSIIRRMALAGSGEGGILDEVSGRLDEAGAIGREGVEGAGGAGAGAVAVPPALFDDPPPLLGAPLWAVAHRAYVRIRAAQNPCLFQYLFQCLFHRIRPPRNRGCASGTNLIVLPFPG